VTVVPSGAENALEAQRRIASKTIAMLIPCRKSLTLANSGLSSVIIVGNPISAPGNITRSLQIKTGLPNAQSSGKLVEHAEARRAVLAAPRPLISRLKRNFHVSPMLRLNIRAKYTLYRRVCQVARQVMGDG
jgi:hypothetical protein